MTIAVTDLGGEGEERLVRNPLNPSHLVWRPF